jgi:hypothetical protein
MTAEQEFDPEPILRALNDQGVEYVVVGGLAAAAHGVVRATAALDLVVERSWDNAGRLAAALVELAGGGRGRGGHAADRRRCWCGAPTGS